MHRNSTGTNVAAHGHRCPLHLPLRTTIQAHAFAWHQTTCRQQAPLTIHRSRRCGRLTRGITRVHAQGPQNSQRTEQKPQVPANPSQQRRHPGGQEQEQGWGFFKWERYATPWQVPWGGKEASVGMVAWAFTFLVVGLVAAPVLARAAGLTNLAALSATDKSYLVLANQVAETAAGIAVVRWAVKGFEPLPKDFFNADPREPFKAPRGWLAWGLLGVGLAPLVIGLTVTALSYSGYQAAGGQGTADGVARIISLDLPTYASLFTVTAVLAPILEETVFRGFLLTSLTKWMPTPAAVLVSATAFGLAHLSQRDLPQLIALGTLLGFSYVRSRNLLTPMLIHGTWNGVVLTVLYGLTASGVDVKQLLAQ